MDKDTRKKELFVDAMSNLMQDKLGISIDSDYGAAYCSRATLLTKMGQEDAALEDMKMVSHLSNLNIESFANDNNVWRSRQLQMQSNLESEMQR